MSVTRSSTAAPLGLPTLPICLVLLAGCGGSSTTSGTASSSVPPSSTPAAHAPSAPSAAGAKSPPPATSPAPASPRPSPSNATAVRDCRKLILADKNLSAKARERLALLCAATAKGGAGTHATPGGNAAAVQDCKRIVLADKRLSAQAKERLERRCSAAAQVSAPGASAAARKACEAMVDKTTIPRAFKERALSACRKKS